MHFAHSMKYIAYIYTQVISNTQGFFALENKALYHTYISIELDYLKLYTWIIYWWTRTCLKIISNLISNVFFQLIYMYN